MDSSTDHSDTSSRLRLVDIRFGAGKSNLHFGGGLAGVLTESSDRTAAALQIATTVIGPRAAEAEGSVDIAGRLVPLQSLPSLLLSPSAPAVLDREDLSAHWQAFCARRRGDLAATHATRRLDRHRVEAALERSEARQRGTQDGGPIEAARPAGEALRAFQRERLAEQEAQLRDRVRSLLVSIDALVPTLSADALALADEWEAHTALIRGRTDTAAHMQAAEERARRARVLVAKSSGGVSDDTRAEIDRRHRVVVQAEAELFEAKRKGRSQAVARYEAAVDAENAALAEAEVDSYASFLVAITGGGQPLDPAARQAAQVELAGANAALEAARSGVAGPTDTEVRARSVELRTRAERLLGRFVVGGDPPGDLRSLNVIAPGQAELVQELAEVLAAARVAVRDDPVATARALLAVEPTEPFPGGGANGSLAEQRLHHERVLAELEAEIARLDRIYSADIADIEPDDVGRVMESLLDSYRAGNLLGGRLPVVFDGALDPLTAAARQTAVQVLAAASDVQSIVVTDDLQVMHSVTEAGGTIVLWPEDA